MLKMRIKGNFLKDYVKIVNDTPELDWDSYLTEDDWKIVRSVIIPAAWYPVETMGRIGRGIFEMRSNKNYEAVRMHGRARVEQVFDEATMRFMLKDDPQASVRAYAVIAKRYVDEVNVTFEKSGPGFAEICFYPVDDAPAFDLFREIQAGTMERLVELNGGREPRAEFIEEDREGGQACIIRVNWKEG
jgi:hypothetical protein